MKKLKGTKIAVIAALSGIGIGGIALGAGIAMGGSPLFYYDKNGIHVKENTAEVTEQDYVLENTKTGKLKGLDIELENADLEIVPGNDWTVEYVLNGFMQEPEFALENGTLCIRESRYGKENTGNWLGYDWFGYHWWGSSETYHQSPYVRVTVPDGAKLEEVSLINRYGDVRVDKKLYARETDLYTENGEVRMDGWEGNRLNLEMLYGELVTGALEGEDVTLKNRHGGMKLGTLAAKSAQIEAENGDLTADVTKAENMDVDMQYGNVTLNLHGGMDVYGVSLHSDYGTIRTPEGTVEENECMSGSDFIRMNGEKAGIRVNTESGDIRIREK